VKNQIFSESKVQFHSNLPATVHEKNKEAEQHGPLKILIYHCLDYQDYLNQKRKKPPKRRPVINSTEERQVVGWPEPACVVAARI